jgi:hypothetical protein
MLKLFNDVVSKEQQETYFKISKSLPWCYNTSTLTPNGSPIESDSVFDVGQLTYAFSNETYDLFQPLLNYFGEYLLVDRIKYNLLWRSRETSGRHNGLHQDGTSSFLTGVYYVNDSDGDTVIIDNNTTHKIKPKKGSLLIFPSNLNHASSNPSESYNRIVINMVVKIK